MSTTLFDATLMHHALDQARKAAEAGEVPIGAVLLTPSGELFESFNQIERTSNATPLPTTYLAEKIS